LQSAVRVNKYF